MHNSQCLTIPKTSTHLYPLKSLLIVHGLIHNYLFLSRFLDACFHLGAPYLALSTFKSLRHRPALPLLNLILKRLSNLGLYQDLLLVYKTSGCLSNRFTFPVVIKACSALGAFGFGREVHCAVLRNGYGGNAVVGAALVDFYARLGFVGIAQKVIDRIPQPDLVCYNALIAGCSLNGFDRKVFEALKRVFVVGLRPNSSTLASVIPVCAWSGRLQIGRSLHGFGVKCGCFGDDFLIPALISMYASGSVSDLYVSRKLFDCVVERSVAVWNAMISVYTQKRMPFEAFEVFRDMILANVRLDFVTFLSIIPSCENAGNVWLGEMLHAFVIKSGSGNHASVLATLVSMYAKLGEIDMAEFLFHQMPNREVLSWNVMIAGYERNELRNESLAAFSQMQFTGVRPNEVSIVSVLSACSELDAILPGKSAHAFSTRMGIDSKTNISNALLAFYFGANHLSSSLNLFSRMPTKNDVSWNTMISGCVHTGEEEMALDLLVRMQEEGMALDVVTLISVLPVFYSTENLGQGRTLHGYAIKSGFDIDVSLVNALISMYSKCGDLEAGRSLFEVMPRRCVVSWNALITACRKHNLQNEVVSYFYDMITDSMRPDSVTLLNLVAVSSSQLQGRSTHAIAIRTGILHETRLLSCLISMYARFKNLNSCLALFEMGEKRNISLWNAIIAALVQTNTAEKAVAFFYDLLHMDLQPDNITFVSLISACAQLNNLNLAQSIMAWVVRKGFGNDSVISNALMDVYARCADLSTAKSMFEEMTEKDVVSWNVMINGYGLHGNAKAAFEMFSEMQLHGIRPDNHTFLSMLSICSHAGLVKQGFMVFNSMEKHGMLPRMEHYACIVDMLGRAGRLDDAYKIVKKLPFTPSVSLLESLLGACRLHGNIEVGEKIGQMIFVIDPGNSGLYLMLSSIYAEAGRWEDAKKVRSNIEGRHLRKIPGFSLLLGDRHHEDNSYKC